MSFSKRFMRELFDIVGSRRGKRFLKFYSNINFSPLDLKARIKEENKSKENL